MKVSKLKANSKNPRQVRDAKFDKLKKSIQEFPKMMELRPIVYDPVTMEVLGGNMRLRAIQDLNMKEIPDNWVKSAADLTDEEKERFVITDNVSFGEWDFDVLANEWDGLPLTDWGMDLPNFEEPLSAEDFKRPEFEGDGKKGADSEKNACYFYIEFYENPELYAKLREAIGKEMDTVNRVNAAFFTSLILDK